MASGIFRVCKIITNCARSNYVINNATATSLLMPNNPLIQNARNTTSFFMKRSASELWKSVTSVSNAGRRRGRARNLPRIRDLNKGKRIGWGKVPIIFPGLNAAVMKGDTLVERQRISQEEMPPEAVPSQTTWITSKRYKVPALKRGWTGGSPCGRTFGPPDPIDDYAFVGFESWILYHKIVSVMTSNMGRAKCCRAMIVTGNRNGLAGFAMTNGTESKSSLTAAKTKAGQRLMAIQRYNDHTVMHDFFTQFGNTKIYVEQKHKGYGLKCHRVIKTCCEAIGITDLYAKVEGAINVPHIVKAFFIGLLKQKTFQEMADEKGLHLVEMRRESSYFPKVLASPAKAKKKTEIGSNEVVDYKQYLMDGKIFLKKKPYVPFYTRLPSWSNHLRKKERTKIRDEVIIRSKAEYGDICSFLAEKYPEASASKWRKHDQQKEEINDM